LVDAAHDLMDGRFDDILAAGELDDPKLLKRVAKWRKKAPVQTPGQEGKS